MDEQMGVWLDGWWLFGRWRNDGGMGVWMNDGYIHRWMGGWIMGKWVGRCIDRG